MTYEQIIRRIADNLGVSASNGVFRATARRDIHDVLQFLVRQSEFPKKIYETQIVSSKDTTNDPPLPNEEASLPSDFYLPVEVIFFATSGNRYNEIEMTRETYERWIPNVNIQTQSFSELVTNATPQEMIWTQENFDYDGYIGYHFTATEPRKIIWKPAVNGTLKIYYTNDIEQFTANEYANSPGLHKVFSELIVDSVTVKMLTRKYRVVKTEVELLALRNEIAEYKEKVKRGNADYIGYTQKDAQTNTIEGFNFLNDPAMLL